MRAIVICLALSACGAAPPDLGEERAVGVVRPAAPEPQEVETLDGCVLVVEPCEEFSDDPEVCGGFPECFYAGDRYGRHCGGKRGYTTWGSCNPVGGSP